MRAPVVLLITLCGLLAGAVTPARAASFTITLDTSALVGLSTFELDFQLVDGDGVANTQVVLRSFDFGTGAAGNAVLDGGAAESPTGTFTVQDTWLLNAVLLPFTPGATLSFLLEVSGSSGPSSPDFFTMALLDSSGFEVPTLGSVEELLSLALVAGAAPVSFGTDEERTNLSVPTPVVTAVPEPTTLLLIGIGLVGLARRWRR